MQLSKLEIRGFKSFGDKVVIYFDKGITGIVGPNGCGKSNVVDSIRWVLGEQKTKALRSDKMENVIFNGTKNRKQLQMAEVSLTFNNTKNILPTEYSQVTITRRYYRTGESEYLLNGITCRLKDIHNLFLDTGVGSDSYAIIELKMVDDILNDRDHSRRGLFEEAAGISKFKVRKKEALKKLEEADKDLERVEDLLYEINKNLKQLERQAKQAERYFEIKNEYKKVSVELAKVTVLKHGETSRRLEKQLAEAKDEKTILTKLYTEKEAEVEKEKAEIINKEKLLASRQKALNDQVNKIRQYESEKKIKNERLKHLNDKADSLQTQNDYDKLAADEAAMRLRILEDERTVAEKQLADLEQVLEDAKENYEEQKLNTAEVQADVNLLSRTFREKQDEVYQLNKKLEIAQIQLSSLKQELEKTSSDSSRHNDSLMEFEEKLQEISGTLADTNEELQQAQNAEASLQTSLEQNQQETAQVRETLTEVSRKLDARQNEYNLTKSLVDNLEGFPEAIKFLKKTPDWHKNVPLLSDILTCDEKYRAAIENFLEPYMNYYVVDDEAQSIQAVNLLSNSAKGKANFFILSRIASYAPALAVAMENTIPALQVAEYDAKYKSLISYILDKVYIVTDKKDSYPHDENLIFITQDGGFTKRPFSISGGSVGMFEGKRIGRAKNLENLEKEIGELNSHKGTLQARLTELLNKL